MKLDRSSRSAALRDRPWKNGRRDSRRRLEVERLEARLVLCGSASGLDSGGGLDPNLESGASTAEVSQASFETAAPQHGEHDDGKGLGASAPVGIGGDGPFAARNIELLARLPLNTIGGSPGVLGNDIWGWTDPATGKEYALYGRSNGTSFVDISDPSQPVYVGNLPSHTGSAAWRDIKVYQDHAFIVADSNGDHGMQIFDLTQLRGVTSFQTFSATAHYDGFENAHNLALNEASGRAYAVGTNTADGGLHIIDVSQPAAPAFLGEFAEDGYTHDAQVVVYHGPDASYAGREIAFNSNEDTLTIVDVTDAEAPVQLARQGYAQSAYSHQGWLTEDHRYFLMNDELDESRFDTNTRTHVWDVSELEDPAYVGAYENSTTSRDHNLFVHDGLIYEANYTTGLRVLQPTSLEEAAFTEIAFLDTYPSDDAQSFNGAWGVYPFFESGTLIVNDRQNGLFVLRLAEPAVAARHIFYNESAFDDENAAGNESDDAAIATDKRALQPGETATFENYTSYVRGINGILVDVFSLATTPALASVGDFFEFRVGNDSDPSGWAPAPLPAGVAFRPGAGENGSDRVTILWENNAIQQQWLQVTVRANAHTGLAESDVHYWGNAIGETGDAETTAQVNLIDVSATRANQTGFRAASIDDPFDFDRDRRVNIADVNVVRAHQSGFGALTLFTAPQAASEVRGSGTWLLAEKVASSRQFLRRSPARDRSVGSSIEIGRVNDDLPHRPAPARQDSTADAPKRAPDPALVDDLFSTFQWANWELLADLRAMRRIR